MGIYIRILISRVEKTSFDLRRDFEGNANYSFHEHFDLIAITPNSPKLVDGLDWVPSSAANASVRLLSDGVTELVRYYCARRTKAEVAKPHVKPSVPGRFEPTSLAPTPV